MEYFPKKFTTGDMVWYFERFKQFPDKCITRNDFRLKKFVWRMKVADDVPNDVCHLWGIVDMKHVQVDKPL